MGAPIAECNPTGPRPPSDQFVKWESPSNVETLPEGVRKNGLLEGIYASGYIEKPETTFVKPVLEIKPLNQFKPIDHKEISIITYIKSWFSIEAWYSWYSEDIINAQENIKNIKESAKKSNIFLIPTIPSNTDKLILIPEATNNMVNIITTNIVQHNPDIIIKNEANILDEITNKYKAKQLFIINSHFIDINEIIINGGFNMDQYNNMSLNNQRYIYDLANIHIGLKKLNIPLEIAENVCTPQMYYKLVDLLYKYPELATIIKTNTFHKPEISTFMKELFEASKNGNLVARYFIATLFQEADTYVNPGSEGLEIYYHILKDLKDKSNIK